MWHARVEEDDNLKTFEVVTSLSIEDGCAVLYKCVNEQWQCWSYLGGQNMT